MKHGIILCVDDDPTVLNALRTLLFKILGNENHIEIAESGAEALEIVQEYQQDGSLISVVISDYIMPHMRGDELLVKLHEVSPCTIKIMLTGQSDLEGVKKVINDANLYRFLEKPFNNADFVLTVKAALQAFEHEQAMQNKILELSEQLAACQVELAEKDRQLQQYIN